MLNSSAPRLAASNTAEIYPTHINLVNQSPRRTVLCHSSEKQSKNSTEKDGDIGFGLKSVWVGAELLGNVIGAVKKKKEIENDEPSTSGRPALTREEVLELLRQDYDQNYFISGVGDLRWADPNCRYADPFAGFNGTERFQRNVSNLGGLLKDVDLQIFDWTIREEDGNLQTRWRFSAILDLPWKPRLAAAGGTLHVFDPETNLVIQHIESWDVEPGKVIQSLLKPSSKVPTSNWEVLMMSVVEGDAMGIWLASSLNVLKLSAAVLGLSVVLSVVTGDGLGIWPVAAGALVTAAVTEVRKISGGMGGNPGS